MSSLSRISLVSPLAVASLCALATAQAVPESSRVVPLVVDSGFVANASTAPALSDVAGVVWSRIIHVPNAPWIRLHYEGVLLAGDEAAGNASFLRITALKDGAPMTQHGSHVMQWNQTSAYFNGEAVRVEILAFPGTGSNRFVLKEVTAGLGSRPTESICGPNDDRQLSSDNRAARNQPTGCTSWMIDDCNHCFLTAGHCAGGGLQLVEFNVPLSGSDRSLRHPPPQDQYAVDRASLQTNGGQGIGDDWAYFGVFANSTTGRTPFQAYGQAFTLASSPPPVSGQNIRITGFGTTAPPVSDTWTQVQKTHDGPYALFSGSTVRYVTDTSDGNSGSPVIIAATGEAIGIHTNGGCNTRGSNSGTGSNNTGLRNALSTPLGVCRCDALGFDFPSGRPDLIDPAGGTTMRVAVSADGVMPQQSTGRLHVDTGSGFRTIAMQQVAPNVYDAVFPAASCGSTVRYYVSAADTGGTRHTDPVDAPAESYDVIVAIAAITFVAYDFDTAPAGWTVSNSSLSEGAWARAVPAGNNGSRGDPRTDADGSGFCWVTGNANNEDLDGGPTVLTTETFDLHNLSDPRLRYSRWMTNDDDDDFLDVEIWDNATSRWRRAEHVGHTTGWNQVTLRIASYSGDLSNVRVRFSVADQPNNSVTEAGIDAFEIFEPTCVRPTWTAFGNGCAGSGGTPTLAARAGQLPAIGETFELDVTNLPTGAQAFGLLGFSNTSWPPYGLPLDLGFIGMDGCTLYTDVAFADTLNVTGSSAAWSLALPLDPNLLGRHFYQQVFVADPPANNFGATTSNAGDGVFGAH